MNAVTRLAIGLTLVFSLVLSGCSDKGLETAAKTIAGVSSANETLTKEVIAEQGAGVISESDARAILNNVCDKVATAVEITASATEQYTKFPPGVKVKVGPLLQPILDAIQSALDSGISGIKNPQSKEKVKNTLLVIKTGIASAQAALGGN